GAPVSRQAHALLDVDGNGGGLGQQHSDLLPCLRYVGVSRDYRPVYSAACRRGSGGCLGDCRMGNVSRWHNEKLPSQVTSAAISMGQQSRRLELPRGAARNQSSTVPAIPSFASQAPRERPGNGRPCPAVEPALQEVWCFVEGGCFGLPSGSCIARCRRQWRGPRAAAQRAPAVPSSRGCEPGHRPTSQQRRDHIGLRARERTTPALQRTTCRS
ncbi:hypothetical protein V5799_002734, partial [Amblyomma americanum]